ncbi:MAG TPA: 30S ribosomal protein S27ae [Methanospirillum sp.]|jgi:small subunit ribosomal protein S27Ae|uniref:30S ribosomal protein S27ae n=1 Tax=Methanospirillum sp. TaxID=45200 RepID=UPI0009C44F6F|nr:30S ribosomal protein S27ae [Methanospirillum sp.]NLL11351.1 30S ribosomal protein S27ae [Methanomicrobiales archaeon]OQB39241.1 MAG: 30S ribosomal protein S27ae [Euryarchaeota archaeon ADurb.Bin165]HPY59957.1 30S ribosomal protein S27ae [Methanospirillum sp.]HQB99463.1 30S ribosomal protein S27ae [Methanospirillum sp.]
MAAKGKKTEKAAVKRSAYFKVEGKSAVAQRRYCPRCGPGVFMGEHKDRVSCGKCGYTEFKK